MTRADVDLLAKAGFNSIRLPMHYNLFTLPIEDEPVGGRQTWLDKGFVLLDSLISWCAANASNGRRGTRRTLRPSAPHWNVV